MSTTFKKGWYQGKPLREVLPNTKYFKYWYQGKPFPLFDKPAVPSIPVTIQLACLHLTFIKYSPTINWGYVVVISTIQPLILSAKDPVPRAGAVEGSRVLGSGAEVLFRVSPVVTVYGSGSEIVYSPEPSVVVSQVFVQVEYAELSIQVDHAGIAVVSISDPYIQVDHAGIAVIYSIDGVFLVNSKSLVLSLHAPTVVAIFITELDFQHLTLALHAPFITISYSVTALPVTKHLTGSQKSPSVRQGCSVTTSLVSLNFHVYSPSVFIGAIISETLDAVLAIYSPMVRLSSRMIVSKLALVLTYKTPSINHNVIVSISDLLPLLFVVYTCAMRGGVNLDETLSLILHQATAPTITWGQSVSISAAKHLVLSIKSVTVTVHSNVLLILPQNGIDLYELSYGGTGYHVGDIITPNQSGGNGATFIVVRVLEGTRNQGAILELTLLTHGGGYVVANNVATFVSPAGGSGCRINIISVSPFPKLFVSLVEAEVLLGVSIEETQYLTLNRQTPAIRTSCVFIVSILSLVLQKYAPSVHVKTVNLVDVQSLVLNTFDGTVIMGYVIKEIFVITLHQHDVTIRYGATIVLDVLSLYLTTYDPGIISEPFVPYNTDPLHKEREWGSCYTLGQGEYASRSGTALTSRFPLQSTDVDKQMTVCCWIRLKDITAARQTVFVKLRTNAQYSVSFGLFLLWGKLYLMWGNSQFPGLEFDVTLIANRWYHLGLAIDGVNKTVYLHVWDDKARTITSVKWMPSKNPYPQSALSVGDGDFHIGYYHDQFSGDMWFNGYIDEFVVFNKLKSPFEIDQIRKGRFNGPEQGQTVGDFSLTCAYEPQGKITAADAGSSVGYSPHGAITISDYALMVAYKVEIPPPPSRFPVISGFPSPGSGTGSYVFCNLAYKFKSDVASFDYGSNVEARVSHFSLPIRELETMIGIADESSFLRLYETLAAGATIYSVPIWAFRTVLDSNAHAGDFEFIANDVANLYVGEKALLVRANDASIYDLCNITGVAGHTVSIETALTLHHHKFQMPTIDFRYDARSCYVVPCITGIVDAVDVELKGNKPTFFLKVKVNGEAWVNAGRPEVLEFIHAPAEAGLISPKVERTIVGTENGLIEMLPHLLTARLAFQAEWYFKDTSWRDFRDLFLTARGKALTISMPTWCFELRVMAYRNAGSSTIVLTSGFEHIWLRFKRLLVYPITGASPFVIILDSYQGSNMYSCSELESELYIGDKVSLYPDVRFMEDELVFEFLYYNECKVKTSFIEVVD